MEKNKEPCLRHRKKRAREQYEEFLYKDVFYVIDVKKLDFTLGILKTNKKKFFEIENLKKFFQEYNLLCEEFLDFISISKNYIEH